MTRGSSGATQRGQGLCPRWELMHWAVLMWPLTLWPGAAGVQPRHLCLRGGDPRAALSPQDPERAAAGGDPEGVPPALGGELLALALGELSPCAEHLGAPHLTLMLD